MTTRKVDPNFLLDKALADPMRIVLPLTKDQKDNLRAWDYYLYDLTERIHRHEAKKAADAVK